MKILISDFDATFYRFDDYETTIKNVEAASTFVEKGNIFIIATGRPIHSLKPLLEEFQVPYTYLITNDGACILDSDLNIIRNTIIDDATSFDLFNLINNNKYCGMSVIDDGSNYLLDYVPNVEGILTKIIDLEKCSDFLEDIKNSYLTVNGYLNGDYILIHEYRVNKTFAIKALLEKLDLGIKPIVVGDSINDIDMVSEYDGFAMNDSYDILKKRTNKYVDGVYQLLNSK